MARTGAVNRLGNPGRIKSKRGTKKRGEYYGPKKGVELVILHFEGGKIRKLGNFLYYARMILNRSGRANAISQFPNSKIPKSFPEQPPQSVTKGRACNLCDCTFTPAG